MGKVGSDGRGSFWALGRREITHGAGAGVGEGAGEVAGGEIGGEKLEDKVGREKDMGLRMDGDGDRGSNVGGNGGGGSVCGGIGMTATRGGGGDT